MREAPCTDTTIWNVEWFGCNPENYVRLITYWSFSFTHSGMRIGSHLASGRASPAPPLEPGNANPDQLDWKGSHFPGIGVPSAQQSAVIASSHL
jgi:hypothetical protein